MSPEPSGLRLSLKDFLPTSTVFVAANRALVIGTTTAKLWCSGGFPADSAFHSDLISLRLDDPQNMESTKFATMRWAVEETGRIGRMSAVGASLLRALYEWCATMNVREWIVVVNPKVLNFYKDELGFELLVGERACDHVANAPGVLLKLNVRGLRNGLLLPTPTAAQLFMEPNRFFVPLATPFRYQIEEVAALLIDHPQLARGEHPQEKRALLKHFPRLKRLLRRITKREPRPPCESGVVECFSEIFDPHSSTYRPPERIAPFALRRLLADLLEVLILRAERKGVRLTCVVDDGIPDMLVGDSRGIGKLFTLLTETALDAARKGEARVSVQGALHLGGTVELHLHTEVTIDHDLTRVYEAAEILGSRVRRLSNSGLDRVTLHARLTLQHYASHLHGFVLPILNDHTAADSPSMQSLRVLVVEDDMTTRLLLQRLLTRWGHQVDSAQDGEVALELLAHSSYDLLLLDIQMPRLNGFETSQKVRRLMIRAVDGNPLPIYALTSFVLPGDSVRCLSAGMDGHLGKPLSSNELRKLLLRIQRPAAASAAASSPSLSQAG